MTTARGPHEPKRAGGELMAEQWNDGDAAEREWIVICVGCLRIKRDGVWTKERAMSVHGHSTGFCDRCVKEHRKEHGRGA